MGATITFPDDDTADLKNQQYLKWRIFTILRPANPHIKMEDFLRHIEAMKYTLSRTC